MSPWEWTEHTAPRARWATLILALAATACAVGPASRDEEPDPLQASRFAREADLNRAWKERPYSELVRALGPPRLLLDIPGGGNPRGFVAVYPRDPETGCLDTFAMAYGARTAVRSYQCR